MNDLFCLEGDALPARTRVVAIDGTEALSQTVPPEAVCVQRRDTTMGQTAEFATGGALLAGGAGLSYLGWRHHGRKVTLFPDARSRGVSLHLAWSY